jgi:RHS repeat-associated protein
MVALLAVLTLQLFPPARFPNEALAFRGADLAPQLVAALPSPLARPSLAAPGGGATTTRVSVSSSGAQANGQSLSATPSRDGSVIVFQSFASNLVPGDTNSNTDIFTYERATGAVARITVGFDGSQTNGQAGSPSISGDGRWVAFTSIASNLVPADTNGRQDVFLFDRVTRTMSRISVTSAGQQSSGHSFNVTGAITFDGRYVGFNSFADLTSPVDGNVNITSAYVYDRVLGTIRSVCVNSDGIEVRSCFAPSISDDGRYVAFDSDNAGLVTGDTNGRRDVFLRDMLEGRTVRLSVSSSGAQGNFDSCSAAITADGRFVAFASGASTLVDGDTNGFFDVFVRDLASGSIERVSLGQGGVQSARGALFGGGGCGSGAGNGLSADGRYVVFRSSSTDLVPGDTNGRDDVFVFDRSTGNTTRVSVGSNGAQGDRNSADGRISGDGSLVVFNSSATNLVDGDTNGADDIFIHIRAPAAPSDEVADELGAGFGADATVGVLIAEPVNTLTGNLTLAAADLAIPGRGPPLRLVRSYNARDPRVGAFGPGWSSDLAWRVRERSNGDAVLFRPDGRRDVFHKQADGTYAPPSGVFDALTARAGGGFFLRTVDQLTVLFASDGLLTSIADRNGNALTYTFDLEDRIVQIEASGGRSISFGYGADGRLVRASDSAGRSVAYAYTDGRLAEVTDPTGAVTRYAYDASDASGRLLTVTDPLGHVTLRNAYDADGRVTSQTDAVGGTTTFAYGADRVTTTTGPRGALTRIAHDAAGRATALTDASARTLTYAFDARGALAGFTDRNGSAWRFNVDARGNRTGVTDPAGASASFTFDERNDLLTRADPLGNTWRYEYDTRGNLVRTIDPEGAVTVVEVDAHGQPTTITDSDGVAVSYAYDAAGNATSVTTAAGTATTAYDPAGRPVRRTDANAHATAFAYDAAGRLTTVIDPLGASSALAYDAAGNLAQATDRRGARTAYAYDAARRLVRVTEALGGVTTFAYDAAGNRTSITDPAGQTTRFTYDLLERLESVTDPEGGTSRFGYDANGSLVAATDPRGGVARSEFNFRNQRERAVDRTGAPTKFAYDAAGRLVRTIDPTGATTGFTYDRAGRYVSTTDALGGITALAYTGAGRLASRTDPRGGRTAFAYDGAGRLVTLTDALGGAVRYAYDAAGNRTSRTDALGRVKRSAYDAADRLLALTDPAAGTTRFGYDAEGALTVLTDALGAQTRYAYDPLGRLVGVTDALGGATGYELDPRGLLTRLVDANGNARTYAYDGARRLVREADPLGRARTYAYDASGNLVTATDPKGQATRYAYDAEDRLVETSRADGELVRYIRDPRGLRTVMADDRGMTAYAYDALRRLVSVTDPLGRRVGYAYDASGNRTRLDYPDGRAAEYAYDALDRLASVAFAGGSTRYSYDALGNAVAASFANATRVSATYDALDRPTVLAYADARGRPAASFTYAYDAAGNVVRETADGARDLKDDRAYAYDPLRRLVSVTDRDKKATDFRYDPVGNRTATSREGKLLESASYDVADQLTALMGRNGKVEATFAYDANGNLVARARGDDVVTLDYDAADRLRDRSDTHESVLFAYDGDGNLVREQRVRLGDLSTRTLDHTLDVAGPLTQVLAASDGRDAATYLYGLGRLAAFGATETRFFASDVRGSPRLLTDERGAVAGLRGFDAWGVPDPNSSVANASGPAALGELFGFTGERHDTASGLLYLRARWYDPSLGRFLTRDPVAGARSDPRSDPRTQHPYWYALDNPTSLVDHSGLSASSLFDGATGYAYEGTDFYGDPAARPRTARRPFGQSAAYAVAQVFADLDSTDPWTQAGAFLKVSAFGVAVAVPVALALPESLIATGGSAIASGATVVATGAAAVFQRAQSFFSTAARAQAPVAPTVQKIAVIGENQQRVLAQANELGAATMPAIRGTHLEKLAANRDWIQRLMDEGYTILNIGRDPRRIQEGREISEFFQAELQEIVSAGYTNVIPGPWPVVP